MFARNRLFLLLLAAPVLLGCESESAKELKKRPASRESSARIAFPPGGTWWSAVMLTETGSFERAYGGRGGIGSATYYYARTTLVLARAGGGEDRVPVSAGSVESTEANAALDASDRKWRLALPADCRGVGFAPEGVEEWGWVCCDGPRPFHCAHLRLEARGDQEPCANAPRWRDLALQMMSPPDAKSLHPQGPDSNEWIELAALIGADPSHVLIDAFAGAALREKSGLNLGIIDARPLQQIQEVVGGTWVSIGNPKFAHVPREVRASARSVLGGSAQAGSVVASNAALLLARSKEEEDLRAIAGMLVSEDWAPAATVVRDMEWPRAVAWSLARAVDAGGALPKDVEAALIRFLESTRGKPESALPVVFALVAHPTAESSSKLAELSAPDLDGGTQGKPDPEWPETLDEVWEAGVVNHGALTHPLDAWIRAALKARK